MAEPCGSRSASIRTSAGQFAGPPGRRGARRPARRVADGGACAIGEIGLDYHYDFSPRDVQQAVFRAQVGAGRSNWRCRSSSTPAKPTDDTFAILRDAGAALRGVFHCFTGDVGDGAARRWTSGFYISLAGIVTFPRADALREVAALVPADRLLVETDAPYLAPVPHRGKRNEPAFVARVAETVAGASRRRRGGASARRRRATSTRCSA